MNATTQQLLVHADDVNVLGEGMHSARKQRNLIVASDEIGPVVNAE